MCALKHVLTVRLATQFTINFLYLDIWLWRYISPTLLGQLSISFIPSGELNNIFQSHVGFGARVLAFSLEKAPTLPKNPSVHAYLSLLCVCKCVCVVQAGMWFKSVMCCRCVSVQQYACVSFSPWPVASGPSHLLPCHNRHSAAVFHLKCTHSQHTHTHIDFYTPRSSIHILTFPHIIKLQKKRGGRNKVQESHRNGQSEMVKGFESLCFMFYGFF